MRATRGAIAAMLLAILIGVSACSGGDAAPARGSGLVASYGFNESDATGLRFGDFSGRRNGAVGHNVRRVPGRFGRGVAFNGASSWLNVRHRPSLDLTGSLTLEAWVKPQPGTKTRTILAKLGPGANAYALHGATFGGGAGGEVDAGGARELASSDDLPFGRWSHVALTYDGSTLRFYRDGQEAATASVRGPIAMTPGPLRIGGNFIGGGWFKGVIDEVRIYNRALTAAEVRRDMRRSAGGVVSRPRPGAAPAPATVSAARPGPFAFGVVSTTSVNHIDDARNVGARITRIEFPIGTSTSAMREFVDRSARDGVEVILLAGFHGRVPSRADARSLAVWAREFGPGGTFWNGRSDGAYASRYIEFGNETGYSYQGTQDQGGDYARRARDAYAAITAANPRVGLLIQADDGGRRDASPWIDDMFNAVPDIGNIAAGWVLHPYGPPESWQPRLDYVLAETASRGAPDNVPIFITEWGLATDNGNNLSDNYDWPTNMTYAQAGAALTSTVRAMRARAAGRIRVFLYFTARDQKPPGTTNDREAYFGVLKADRSDKGALTAAVRAFTAKYPAH